MSFSCPIWWWATARKLGRFASGLLHVRVLLTCQYCSRKEPTENICSYVQEIRQNCTTTMQFLKTYIITLSCLASAAPQADTWWLGHVEPDDVVIADIGGQALDILLHGPESAHKNGIVKTFTHTSIPTHPCTLLKQTNSKTLNSPNMTPSFSCPLPVQCAGGRRPTNWHLLLTTATRRRPPRLGQYWHKHL